MEATATTTTSSSTLAEATSASGSDIRLRGVLARTAPTTALGSRAGAPASASAWICRPSAGSSEDTVSVMAQLLTETLEYTMKAGARSFRQRPRCSAISADARPTAKRRASSSRSATDRRPSATWRSARSAARSALGTEPDAALASNRAKLRWASANRADVRGSLNGRSDAEDGDPLAASRSASRRFRARASPATRSIGDDVREEEVGKQGNWWRQEKPKSASRHGSSRS